MENYADSITAVRVKRVIDGYSNVEGTGGDFIYYNLGEALLLQDGNLNEGVDERKIREYIYYMVTKEHSLKAIMLIINTISAEIKIQHTTSSTRKMML